MVDQAHCGKVSLKWLKYPLAFKRWEKYINSEKRIRELVKNGSYTGFFAFKPENESIRYSNRWGEKRTPYSKPYLPEAKVMIFLNTNDKNVQLEVMKEGVLVAEKMFEVEEKGFSHLIWDVKINPVGKKNKRNIDEWIFADKGIYELKFTNAGKSQAVKIEVK